MKGRKKTQSVLQRTKTIITDPELKPILELEDMDIKTRPIAIFYMLKKYKKVGCKKDAYQTNRNENYQYYISDEKHNGQECQA